jgi:hypothetical protein
MKAESTAKRTVPKKVKMPFFSKKKKVSTKLSSIKDQAIKPKTIKEVVKKQAEKKTNDKTLNKGQLASLNKPIKEIKSAKEKYKSHKEPSHVAKEKFGAALLPVSEADQMMANKGQTNLMGSKNKDEFNKKDSFKNKLQNQINQTIESKAQAKSVATEGVGQSTTTEIATSITNEKDKAGGEIDAATKEPGDVPKLEQSVSETPGTLSGITQQSKTVTQFNTELTPQKKSPEETDFTKETKTLDDQYSQNNLSKDKLQNSDEPSFVNADNQKSDSQEKAKELTNQYRTSQDQKIASTKSSNSKAINGVYQSMLLENNKINGDNATLQQTATKAESKTRKDVRMKIDGIYATTNTKVLECFKAIDDSVATFSNLLTLCLNLFSASVARLLDENTGIFNNVVAFVSNDDLMSEVQIFNQAKKEFISNMEMPISFLSNAVDTNLTTAVTEIAKGNKEVNSLWETLPKKDQEETGDLFETSKTQFAELERSVESKEEAVIENVTEKFSAALDDLNARFDKAKEENKSWLDRAIDAVKAVINTIIELKNAIKAIAKKAAAYADRIIDDPITFFGNLSDSVGQGFKNFRDRIDKHLIKGVLEWLTGSMAGTDIQLPKELNFEGITSLVLQILGFTIKKIKELIIGIIGQERFDFIEKGVDETLAAGNKILNIFKILNEKGVAGLWEFIVEEFKDLKETLIENVKNFVIETITKKAIETLLLLLIPGAGFIKAAQLLIKFVITLFQKAAQIVKIIDGIIDTFGDILNNNLSAATEKVENVFGKFISLAISFLAAVLGIDGIVGKVQKFIQQKIKPRIDKILDNIAQKIKQVVTKMGLTKIIDKSIAVTQKGKAYVEEKKQKAIETGKKIGEKILNFLGIKKKFKAVDGLEHTLFFEGTAKNPKFMIASDKMTFEKFIEKITDPAEKKTVANWSVEVNEILNDDVSSITDVSKREAKIKENEKNINSYLDKISKIAAKYFDFSVLPVSHIQFESASIGGGVMGKKMTAFPLTSNHPGGTESVEDTSNPAYNRVQMRGYGKGSFYVKGHLLNNNLGGPGSWINYTPFPGALFNTSVHYQKYEDPLKKAIKNQEIFYYKVEAIYGRNKGTPSPNDTPTVAEIKEAEVSVPKAITIDIAKHDYNVDTKSYEKSKTQPNFAGSISEIISIEGDGYYAKGNGLPTKIFSFKNKTATMLTAAGIDLVVATKIIERQTKNQIITDYEKQVGATKENILAAIKVKDPTYTDISQS